MAFALRSALTALLYAALVMGSMLDDLIYKRGEYQENCTRFLKASFPAGTGIFCNGTFDVFACWPHSSPGIVSVPCPHYLPWITEGATRNVYKECTADGTWRTEENSSSVWRNQSECEDHYFFQSEEDEAFRLSVLRVLSIVGYSLSFSSLCLAVLIMSLLRKLHCTRNYIHMNLFVSFIFRATAVITKEVVLQLKYTNLPRDESGWSSYSRSAISFLCKASKVSLEYFVGCNYLWLLVEAILLHTLLFTAVLSRRRLLKKYMLIGWGTPLLFVIPWTVAKTLYENKGCWLNNISWIRWIIQGPITLSVIVIFCIFLKIIRLLLSKLKAGQGKFTDYRYSLARATLVLIPLLGIHEIVFTVIIDESVEGNFRYARDAVNLTLSSFQGLLVAVLYCFANGEVQAELKKRWQLFVSSSHLEVHNCLPDIHPKHLWKSSQKSPGQSAELRESNVDGGHAPTQTHPLQVADQSAVDMTCGRSSGLEFYMRKSLSSSDGEMTLGETMEEIIE